MNHHAFIVVLAVRVISISANTNTNANVNAVGYQYGGLRPLKSRPWWMWRKMQWSSMKSKIMLLMLLTLILSP